MTHPQLPADKDLTDFYATRTSINRTPPYEPYQILACLGCEYRVVAPDVQGVVDKIRLVDSALIDFCGEDESPGLFVRDVPTRDGAYFGTFVLASAFFRRAPYFRPMRLLRLLTATGASSR